MTRKIVVTGATGQLGRAIAEKAFEHLGFSFEFLTREDCDLADPSTVKAVLNEMEFDAIMHCGAFTQVDQAESEAELAHRINCLSTGEIARACKAKEAFLLYYSSDYVYHNTLRRPLRESDPCSPKSVYARSKLCGETISLGNCPNTVVIRTSWLYSHLGHNFVRTMLRLADAGKDLRVVNDQQGAPTYAPDLADASLVILDHLFEAGANRDAPCGVYNYANSGETNWYRYALAIFSLTGKQVKVEGIPTSAYPTPAARPPYSVLDCTAVKTTFGIEIPSWEDSLEVCLARMKEIPGYN